MLFSSMGSILLLFAWSVTPQPEDESMRARRRQELNVLQEELLLKLLSGWADNADSNSLETDRGASETNDNTVLHRALSVKLPHLSPRERKAPCKNFFWKTFTVC
ncbi:somatostatin-2-like [Pelodytes ibericus]